ncbi:MAG: hypothetical protein AB8F78_17915 [Saprospiraceae bacterium]
MFYLQNQIEGDHVYGIVLANDVPHRLQKFQESAYAGAMSMNRDWGKLYIPEGELDRFMELTGNTLAPEVEMHIDNAGAGNKGCLGFLMGK